MLIANLLNIQFYYLRKLKDSRIGKCIALPFTVTDFDSAFFLLLFYFRQQAVYMEIQKPFVLLLLSPILNFPHRMWRKKKLIHSDFSLLYFSAILQFLFFNFSLNVGRNSSI